MTTNTTEIQNSVRQYKEQPSRNKLDKLEETDNFSVNVHSIETESQRNRPREQTSH